MRQLLTTCCAEQRASVEASRAPNKKVAVFVYPTERRAKIGGPEWIGRAMAFGENLPEKPVLTLHLPDADAEVPTEREEEIYDALELELNE